MQSTMRTTMRAALTALSLFSLIALSCAQTPAPMPRQTPIQAAPVPPRPLGVRHVFIISFDGGKPAVMKQSAMPTLFSMIRGGAHTWQAQTIFPSITLPSHTSMLTGVGPDKHKILWNDWQPARGLVAVPTAFTFARQRGLRTAMFAGKEKFKHLNLPGTLDAFDVPSYRARTVAQTAARYIETARPNLCFIHFSDPDGAGHQHGWGSPQQMQAFAESDAALALVQQAIGRAGIASSSVLLLSADHGGHDKTHGSNSPDDMIIPWTAFGASARAGYTITAPVTTYDTAATALWLLGVPVPANWNGRPVASAFVAAPAASVRVPAFRAPVNRTTAPVRR